MLLLAIVFQSDFYEALRPTSIRDARFICPVESNSFPFQMCVVLLNTYEYCILFVKFVKSGKKIVIRNEECGITLAIGEPGTSVPGQNKTAQQFNVGSSDKLAPGICTGQSVHGFDGLNGYSPIG